MDATTTRTSLKRRLDIDASVTTFDAQLDEFVLAAVDRLYPIAQLELTPQIVNTAPDTFGEVVIDLATLTGTPLAARRVEAYSGYEWYKADDTFHHGTKLIVRNLPVAMSQLKVYGVSSVTLATVPPELKQAVIWYAMSEFYSFLAGNKSKYNIYASGGARAVDNMKDEADYYEQKANVYLNDRAKLMGIA